MKVVADIALNLNKWERVAFLDDYESLNTSLGLEIIGTSKGIDTYIDTWDFFVAIGNNSTREKIQFELKSQGATITNLIHPRATIGNEVEIAEATVVMTGVVVNPSTKIGRGCNIDTGATVDHDNLIDDFIHISPGVHLAGSVKVGRGCWLGIGSVVSNNIDIVGYCFIGAVVAMNIKMAGIYVGVPAKKKSYLRD